EAETSERLGLSSGEAFRQVLAGRVTRLGLVGILALGAAAGSVWASAMASLEQRHHVPAGGRALVVALAAVAAAAMVAAALRLGVTGAPGRMGVAGRVLGVLALV